MITTTSDKFDFEIIKTIFEVPEKFRFPFENGFHINLERCDKYNNFEWLEKHYKQHSDFFHFHKESTEGIFEWSNLNKWLNQTSNI